MSSCLRLGLILDCVLFGERNIGDRRCTMLYDGGFGRGDRVNDGDGRFWGEVRMKVALLLPIFLSEGASEMSGGKHIEIGLPEGPYFCFLGIGREEKHQRIVLIDNRKAKEIQS